MYTLAESRQPEVIDWKEIWGISTEIELGGPERERGEFDGSPARRNHLNEVFQL